MARARNLKPSYFHDAELLDLDIPTRLLFAGLWCYADREGRLIDNPKQIKLDVFPADAVDVPAMLAQLATCGFIVRYQARGQKVIQIKNFAKHQNPHIREPQSSLPGPDTAEHSASTVPAPDKHSAGPAHHQHTPSPFPLPPSSPPHPVAAPSRPPPGYGSVSAALREQGVNVDSQNPVLRAWVDDGYVTEWLLECVSIARQHKPAPQRIPAKYLDPIVRRPRDSPRVNGEDKHTARERTIRELTTRSGDAERDITSESTRIPH